MPAPRLRILRAATRTVAVVLLVLAATLGGMCVALLAFGDQRFDTEFGSVDLTVTPTMDGSVEVYVPLVDWRVRLLAHDAPARIELELRGIDRARAGAGIGSSSDAARSLAAVQADSERVVADGVRHAALVAAAGGLAGAALAGTLIGALLLRRRWLLVAPLVGVVVIAAVLVPSVRTMQGLGVQHVAVTSAGGHSDELPAVLRFAEQLLTVGDEYEDHYRTALESIENLATFAGSTTAAAGDESMIVVSDLHDNVFVLDALDDFATDDTVFAVGDFVQVGASVEQRTADDVADLGGRVVAVSGNHDTPEYMQSLRDSGATVLDADEPALDVGALAVAGYPDPLERDEDSRGEHRLRAYGEEYRRQRADFLDWFDSLETRPDVVLVHQHGFAHALLDELAKRGDTDPLLVLTGHDHEPHVHADGPHVIVDAGTLGAGGLAAIGEQEASFARLVLAKGKVVAVDVVAIEPLSGTARSKRTKLPTPIG